MGAERCESCGSDATNDDDILSVQRVYLVALPEGAVSALMTVPDDIEAWCFVCRTMYPHEPVTAE